MENKKITRATIKSFVKKGIEDKNLYIKIKSNFNGMSDMVEETKDNFSKAEITDWSERCENNTLKVLGIWLVGQNRDYFEKYEDDNYIGYEVCNCCGSFIITNKKK